MKGKSGLILATVLFLTGGVLLYIFVLRADGASEIADDTRYQTLIDADGNTFQVHLSEKSTEQELINPKSKKKGFPAEWCWWTKDGKVRDKPFPVLLNQYKDDKSPTFCPDCGRLVVPHNPQVLDGFPVPKVPPTQQEYRR